MRLLNIKAIQKYDNPDQQSHRYREYGGHGGHACFLLLSFTFALAVPDLPLLYPLTIAGFNPQNHNFDQCDRPADNRYIKVFFPVYEGNIIIGPDLDLSVQAPDSCGQSFGERIITLQ